MGFSGLELKLWEAIPTTVFWFVWKMRNKLLFNNVIPKWEEEIDLIKTRIAQWVKLKIKGRGYSIHDFVHNLNLVI